MRPWSAYDLAENWYGTDFRYYHGTVDPGPMKPAFVHALDAHVDAQKIPHKAKWYEAGHDLLYLVHRHGNAYKDFENIRRQNKPAEVHLVTGDFRAARQHWLEVTRFARYPDLARVHGKVTGQQLEITTENVTALALDLRDLPVSGALAISVDGTLVHEGDLRAFGHRLHLVKGEAWRVGLPEATLAKRAGLSGPLTDPYYERMIHVYGSQRPEHEAQLKKLAEKGARGWPLWLWTVEQEVVKDSDLTRAMVQDAHLVLYGTPGANAVLERLQAKLPIRVESDAVLVGDKRYAGSGVGTRFLYPNPEAPGRYVMVMAAPTLDGVRRGHNLSDFLPDYVVYDASSTGARPRLIPAKAPLTRGFFDANWQLVPETL